MGGCRVNAGASRGSAALVWVPGDGAAGEKWMDLGRLRPWGGLELGHEGEEGVRKCPVIQFSCGSFLKAGPRSFRFHCYRDSVPLCPASKPSCL